MGSGCWGEWHRRIHRPDTALKRVAPRNPCDLTPRQYYLPSPVKLFKTPTNTRRRRAFACVSSTRVEG
jgi:hypothetical protein